MDGIASGCVGCGAPLKRNDDCQYCGRINPIATTTYRLEDTGRTIDDGYGDNDHREYRVYVKEPGRREYLSRERAFGRDENEAGQWVGQWTRGGGKWGAHA